MMELEFRKKPFSFRSLLGRDNESCGRQRLKLEMKLGKWRGVGGEGMVVVMEMMTITPQSWQNVILRCGSRMSQLCSFRTDVASNNYLSPTGD